MDGILIVNKPKGWTSHDVVGKIRHIAQMKKVGHAGTLDPIATGVLVVLLGKATKLSDILLQKDKTYRAGVRLGFKTDTYDITGVVISQTEPEITKDEVESVLRRFEGKQLQQPPMYSAVKQGGKKLYELARQGIEVERPLREVEIYSIDRLDFASPSFTIEVHCSKGTYIRSLIHDIGQAMGSGACMESLCRTASGSFLLSDAVTVEQLSKDGVAPYLIPPQNILPVPEMTVDGEQERLIRNGNRICLLSELKLGEQAELKLFGENREFLCLAGVMRENGKQWVQPKIMFV